MSEIINGIKIGTDKYGNCYGPQVVTPVGRVMYVNLATPSMFNDKAKYSINLLLEKTEENKKVLLEEVLPLSTAALTAFYKSEAAIPEVMPSMPFIDGDQPDAEGKLNEAQKGCWVFRAASGEPLAEAAVLDYDCKPYDPAKILGGMFCKLVMHPMAFKYSKQSFGLVWKLDQVQYIGDDGVRLKGAVPVGNLLTPTTKISVPTAGLAPVSASTAPAGERKGLSSL